MQIPVLILEVLNILLEPIDLCFFLSDDASKILQLLHEFDVLVTFFVNRSQATGVCRLHIGKCLLKVGYIAVAGSQGVRELLAEARKIVLGGDPQLAFVY